MAAVAPGVKAGLKVLKLDSIICKDRYRSDFGDLETLVESVREKGIIQPITVDTDLNLLAGERRVRAAKAAGLTEIPALVRRVTGTIDAREIELFENLHRKNFTWDEQAKLVRDIDSLYKEKGEDWSQAKTAKLLDMGTASVSRSIQLANAAEAIPELGDMKTADDAFKTLKKLEEGAIVHELRQRQKDPSNIGLEKGIKAMLYKAENNYNIGDTFKNLTELRSNGVINVIECDPPYGIDLRNLKSTKDSSVTSSVKSYNEVPGDQYSTFITKLYKELYRVAGPHCWLVAWFGPTWQAQTLKAITDAGWKADEIPCIWTKKQGQTMQPELYLGRAYEPFYLARKGEPALIGRGRLNVFDYATTPSAQKYHPTERPVKLIEDILETLTPPGSSVLVPFLGSGATLRAVYNCGMNGFGFELNPEYKDKFMLAIEHDARHLNGEDDEE